jgi:hypothetical protein
MAKVKRPDKAEGNLRRGAELVIAKTIGGVGVIS